jgi:hypothetical protein
VQLRRLLFLVVHQDELRVLGDHRISEAVQRTLGIRKEAREAIGFRRAWP